MGGTAAGFSEKPKKYVQRFKLKKWKFLDPGICNGVRGWGKGEGRAGFPLVGSDAEFFFEYCDKMGGVFETGF